MYRDCQGAGKSIEFEQYILEDDAVGQRFLKLFIDKAKAGVKVFLICDTFGSWLLSRSPLVRQLRRHGGYVHFYNFRKDAWALMPWRWFPRTHTKTLLIDSAIAYTGGVCLDERMHHWRDTHVRVTGPVIAQIRRAFDEIEHRILRKKWKHASFLPKDRRFLYFQNLSRRRRDVYREMARAIRGAEHYIYISSAYFIPGRRILALLKRAHARGVDVRVLVPERSDIRLADWVRLSHTPHFLDAGLRIFHYRETVMHSKTAIIDDRWATVGSTNFDLLSFFYNREANVVTTDREAIAELKRQFISDLQCSTELTWENWQQVPWWKKAAGHAGRVFEVWFR